VINIQDVAHLGISGSRHGATEEQIKFAKDLLLEMSMGAGPKWLNQGCCIGVDAQITVLACKDFGFRIHGFPPLKQEYLSLEAMALCDKHELPYSYSGRNQRLVLASEFLLALPSKSRGQGGGTWNAVWHAENTGVPFIVVGQRGSVLLQKGEVLRLT
jgi:hypothetical protein